MTDTERKEQRMRRFYDEVTPMALQLLRLARTYGMTDMADITVDPRTGYVRCHLFESSIELVRVSEDSELKTKIIKGEVIDG